MYVCSQCAEKHKLELDHSFPHPCGICEICFEQLQLLAWTFDLDRFTP